MDVKFVLAISVLLQITAVFLSLRLIRITGKRVAWILISAAISLMVIRRFISLFNIFFEKVVHPPDLTSELVALATSALLVAGIALIGPLFLFIKRSEEEIRKINRALKVLTMSNQAIIHATEESKLLKDVCRIIVEVGAYRLAWVGFAEQNEKKTVRPVAYAGYEEGYLDSVNITWADTERGRGPTGKAIRTGKPCIVKNILTDPDYTPWRDEATKRGYASSISIPLVAAGQTLGTSNIYAKNPDAFDGEEVELLIEMTNNLAFGIMALRSLTEHKRAEETLRIKDSAIDSSINGIVISNLEGYLTYANQSFLKMWGYDEKEVLGKHILKFCQKEKEVGDVIEALQDEGWVGETKARRKDGSLFHVSFSASVVKNKDDNPICIMASFIDITERKRAEEALKKSKARLTEAQRIAHLGNWDWDIEKNELYWSDEIYRIFGLSPQEFGASYEAFLNAVHPDDREFVKQSVNEALSGKRPYSIDHRIVLPDGTIRNVHEQGEVTHDKPGKPIRMVGTVQDITQQKFLEERINYLAYYDALTGLPNRNLFVDRLNQVIARAPYHKNPFAVLAIDIDGFKSINDTFGLDAGDNVLKEVARTLPTSIREGDTMGRLGGDDFGVLLTDIAHSKDVILVVEKIMKNVSHPIKLDGKEIILSLGIGISVYPGDGEEAHELMRNADLALSKAKQRGRKTYQFYTAGMNEEASEFVLLEVHLFNAFKNEEFILYYQPYWEISTKKVAGVEALIRWQRRDSGLVCPGKFIPVLEKTGMIIEVGEWIFRTACRQVMEWHDNGQVIPVSINLSPVQFMQKDLPETLERIIKETGVDPKLLTMEVTESTFMHDVEFTSSVLKKFNDIGISISIDDFGTGYSSLSYLKRFPVDNLKIDISFIREIVIDTDTASIVTAIISMAHSLNLKTIAEGVETEEQWKILRLLKCDMGQGYYFSKPLPAKDVEKIFK